MQLLPPLEKVVHTKIGKESTGITQVAQPDPKQAQLKSYVTFSYYIKSIEAIKRDILRAWKKQDKVLALQLAIQVSVYGVFISQIS